MPRPEAPRCREAPRPTGPPTGPTASTFMTCRGTSGSSPTTPSSNPYSRHTGRILWLYISAAVCSETAKTFEILKISLDSRPQSVEDRSDDLVSGARRGNLIQSVLTYKTISEIGNKCEEHTRRADNYRSRICDYEALRINKAPVVARRRCVKHRNSRAFHGINADHVLKAGAYRCIHASLGIRTDVNHGYTKRCVRPPYDPFLWRIGNIHQFCPVRHDNSA